MRYFVECSFLLLWKLHNDQQENPVKQDFFLYIYRDTKNDEKLR